MPIFLDRHCCEGVTAAGIAAMHQKDLAVQQQFGVRFLTYWFDESRGTAFCLIDAPDAQTAMDVHAAAHGDVATDVIAVDLSAIEAFLGRVSDPVKSTPSLPSIGGAHRTIMFTDIVDSTGLAARLGDARMVEMVRAHDAIVRRALKGKAGREIKHTGDGIMACFEDAGAAVECACAIQQTLANFNRENSNGLRVRIGLDAGEPVEDSFDLFGATVQRAARLCRTADPETIVVSGAIREAVGTRFTVRELGRSNMKGFVDPVEAFAIECR